MMHVRTDAWTEGQTDSRNSDLDVHNWFCLLKGWETAFRGYKIQDTYIKQIEENAKKNKGNSTKMEMQIQVKCKCDAKQYKEECDNFAKIAEHLVKVVYGVDSHHYQAWRERKHYFDEQYMQTEQFCHQFDKLWTF